MNEPSRRFRGCWSLKSHCSAGCWEAPAGFCLFLMLISQSCRLQIPAMYLSYPLNNLIVGKAPMSSNLARSGLFISHPHLSHIHRIHLHTYSRLYALALSSQSRCWTYRAPLGLWAEGCRLDHEGKRAPARKAVAQGQPVEGFPSHGVGGLFRQMRMVSILLHPVVAPCLMMGPLLPHLP